MPDVFFVPNFPKQLKNQIMKMDRKKPVERMLRRIFKHCKTFEEIQEIWNIQLVLLDGYERKSFYIFVFNEYQFLFKSEKS